jgi:hypothetical protein
MPDGRASRLDVALKLIQRARSRELGELVELFGIRIREAIASTDRLRFFRRDLTEDAVMPVREELRFVEATALDGDRYARDIGTDSPGTFRRRLTSGTRCFLVVSDEVLVHATWLTTTAAWTREIRRYLRPPAGNAYVFESFTRSDARGRGTYPFALKCIVATLSGSEIDRVWVAVEGHNEASLRAVTKAGFVESFEVGYRRRWGRLIVTAPDAPAGWLMTPTQFRQLG